MATKRTAGRPRTPEPTVPCFVRLTVAEKKAAEAYCARQSWRPTLSALIRRALQEKIGMVNADEGRE